MLLRFCIDPTVTFPNEGVIPLSCLTLRRTDLVKDILSLANTRSSVIVQAPPYSGKTSLRQLIEQELTTQGKTFRVIHGILVSSYEGFLAEAKCAKVSDLLSSCDYVLVDDAQRSWNLFLPREPVSSSSSSSASSSSVSTSSSSVSSSAAPPSPPSLWEALLKLCSPPHHIIAFASYSQVRVSTVSTPTGFGAKVRTNDSSFLLETSLFVRSCVMQRACAYP